MVFYNIGPQVDNDGVTHPNWDGSSSLLPIVPAPIHSRPARLRVFLQREDTLTEQNLGLYGNVISQQLHRDIFHHLLNYLLRRELFSVNWQLSSQIRTAFAGTMMVWFSSPFFDGRRLLPSNSFG